MHDEYIAAEDGDDLLELGIVRDPRPLSIYDGSYEQLTLGRQCETIVRQLGGKYSVAAARGNLFIASTAVAGVSLPILTSGTYTTAGTNPVPCMLNPPTSGKNIELVAMTVSAAASLTTLKPTVLVFTPNFTVVKGVFPAVTTAMTIYPGCYSSVGLAPVARLYSVSDLPAMAETLQVKFMPFGIQETVAGFATTSFYFDGAFVMGPDTLMHIAHQSAAVTFQFTIIWSEWPV